MTSTLASQLQKLASATSAQGPYVRGKPSILFTFQEAADVDLESIYHLGLAGFNELANRDQRYLTFQTSLFGRSVLDEFREQQPKASNDALSTTLGSFLKLLSNHFMLPAAFKALEFLIRKFRVNEFDVDNLVECILPYHATNEFVRVVQILALKSSRWEVLASIQKNGAAMPREILVQHCLADQALLGCICKAAQSAAKPEVLNRTMLSFYAVTLCEALARIPHVGEDTVAFLYPYLRAGLKRQVFSDFRASTIMILSKLAARVPLSIPLVTELLDDAARSSEPQDTRMLALLLTHLAASQPHLTQLSVRFLKAAVKLPSFMDDVVSVAKDAPSACGALLRLITSSVCAHLVKDLSLSKCLIHLVHTAPIAPVAVTTAVSLVKIGSQAMVDPEQNVSGKMTGNVKEVCVKVLRVLEQRYPSEVDEAVNELLQQHKQVKDMDLDHLSEDDTEDKDTAGAAERNQLYDFVREAFGAGVHAPTDDATTLSMAINAPAASVRLMAAQRMGELLEQPDLPQSSRALAESALLQRLHDDDWGVVAAVLSVNALPTLPNVALLDALKDVLSRVEISLGIAGGEFAAPRHAARKVLRVLTGLLKSSPQLVSCILPQLLPYLLITPNTRKVSLLALKEAPTIPHALFSQFVPLPAYDETAPASDDTSPTSSPTYLNASTVLSLSTAIQHQPALAADTVLMASSTTLRGQHVLLLALLQTCTSPTSTTAATHAAATALMSILIPVHLSAPTSHTHQSAALPLLSSLQSEDWTTSACELFAADDKLPTAAHTKQLHKSFSTCHSLVQLAALRSALRFAPLPSTDTELTSLFTRLARLRPTRPYLPHLQTLMLRLSPEKSLPFLVERCVCTPDDATATTAVQLAAAVVSSGEVDTRAMISTLLPGAFAALCFPRPTVRAAALPLLDAILQKLRAAQPASAVKQPKSAKVYKAQQPSSAEVFPALGLVADFLAAVAVHAELICADSRAFSHVVRSSLEGLNNTNTSQLPPSSCPTSPSKPKSSKHQRTRSTGNADLAGSTTLPSLSVTTEVLEAGRQLLLTQMELLTGASATSCLLCILSCLHQAVPATALLAASLPQLNHVLALPLPSLTAADQSLAIQILDLIRADTLQASPDCPSLLISLLTTPQPHGIAPSSSASPEIRSAAFKCMTPQLYEALPAEQQLHVFQALLSAAASDGSDTCRKAAVTCLEAVPINAALIGPMLAVTITPSSVKELHKKKKRKSLPASTAQEPVATITTQLSHTIDALQLLQWKDPIDQFPALLTPLHALITTLLPHVSSMAVPHTDADTAAEEEHEGTDGTQAGYAVQLALSAMNRIVEAHKDSAAAADLSLVVSCAQKAPDAAIRNAALVLVAKLAACTPESTLDHVMEVMTVVHESAAMQDDTYSARVASTTLSAVVPAWLQAGRSPEHLWQSIITSLPAVPSHRRLALLSTLLASLPQEFGLPLALLHLLQCATPVSKKSLAKARPELDGQDAWAADLASALSAQVSPADRLVAFAGLMERSVEGSSVHTALPRTVVAFIATELKAKSIQAATRQLAASEASEKLELLQEAGKKLLHQALAHLQMLNLKVVEKAGSRKSVQAATTGLYGLLSALEGVLPSALYLQALVALQGAGFSDGLRRRTLRLFAAKMDLLQQEIGDMDILDPGSKETRTAALATASLSLLTHLPHLLKQDSNTPTTRQAALVAADALARRFGSAQPGVLVQQLSAITASCQDVSLAVQGSALGCVAAIVGATGRKVVPHLPSTVKSVIEAATAASAALSVGSGAASGSASKSGTDSDEEESEKEQQAFKLSAALAAVDAMIEHLGALMSPYTGAIAGLLLQPQVLQCSVAHCSKFAARVQRRLPEALPPRLLFDPLFGLLPEALEYGGPAATAALLKMVEEATSAMDGQVAGSYFDRIFAFILKALDVRQQHPALLAATPDGIARVEACAVSCVVTLVMKLSESKFKPLFLRLMEWANTVPPPQDEANGVAQGPSLNLGRMCAMMAVLEALTKRLRSVFVPYYRYLLDICVHFLTSSTAGLNRPKKKRKQQQLDIVTLSEPTASPVDVETCWVIKFKIVRCLHRCFLSDSVGFLDQEKFERLLPPLVAQLDAEIPVDVSSSVCQQCSDAELDGVITLGPKVQVDEFGRAVVACLTQMAVTSASDVMWKPLNQQALMMTRAASTRTRLLGLEVSAQLIDRLREEFLVLLPETIPFLAELLEDTDAVVEGRAQEVIKALEDVSGEKLEQYLK